MVWKRPLACSIDISAISAGSAFISPYAWQLTKSNHPTDTGLLPFAQVTPFSTPQI
jgi:hypothetical protein